MHTEGRTVEVVYITCHNDVSAEVHTQMEVEKILPIYVLACTIVLPSTFLSV